MSKPEPTGSPLAQSARECRGYADHYNSPQRAADVAISRLLRAAKDAAKFGDYKTWVPTLIFGPDREEIIRLVRREIEARGFTLTESSRTIGTPEPTKEPVKGMLISWEDEK